MYQNLIQLILHFREDLTISVFYEKIILIHIEIPLPPKKEKELIETGQIFFWESWRGDKIGIYASF